MKIKISADSTCDISSADLEKYNIDIFPLDVILGGKEYKDRVDITSADVIDGVENRGLSCSTSAVNVGEYLDKFAEFKKEYDAVIHISLGSGFSSCYRNAVLAANEFENVYVVDSKHLCSGQGGLVIYAAELAALGVSPEEIVRILNETVPKIRFSFLIDGLDYLRRGGRCSAVAAIGANLLSIKPCVETIDGKLEVGKKYRGSMEKCIKDFFQDQFAGKKAYNKRRAIVPYLGIDKRLVDLAVDIVKQQGIFEEVLCYEAGCTIASHCGPGTIAIYLLEE